MIGAKSITSTWRRSIAAWPPVCWLLPIRPIARNGAIRRTRRGTVMRPLLLGVNQLQNHPGVGRDPKVLIVRSGDDHAVGHGAIIDRHLGPVVEIVTRE